jgi:tetratricopeptide (TPR) repeat protein
VYHEWIGEAVEALYPDRLEEYYEVLAYHYVRSGNKDKAVEYLDLANRKAAKASAMAEAKRYFDAAMRLPDTLPETEGNQRRRIALLGNQVPIMLHVLKGQEYYDLLVRYRGMAVGLDNPQLVGAFYMSLGWCAWWFGRLDEAIEISTNAAHLCEAAGNMEAAGLAYMVLQWSYVHKGDYAQVLALQDRALRMLEHRFHLRYYVWELTAISWAYAFLGRWEEAVREGHKALRMGEEYADSSVISFAAMILTVVYTLKNDLGQALEHGELAVQRAPTPGDKAWSQGYLAWVWCRRGELRRGVETLAQAVSMFRAVGFAWNELFFALSLGEGYWRAGEYAKATQTLEELLDGAEHCGMQFLVGSAHRLLGEIALHTDPAQAAPHFAQSIATLRAIHAENELALTYAGYGRWHAQHGNMAQARDYLTRALEIFERLGTLGEPDKVRQALAALP